MGVTTWHFSAKEGSSEEKQLIEWQKSGCNVTAIMRYLVTTYGNDINPVDFLKPWALQRLSRQYAPTYAPPDVTLEEVNEILKRPQAEDSLSDQYMAG